MAIEVFFFLKWPKSRGDIKPIQMVQMFHHLTSDASDLDLVSPAASAKQPCFCCLPASLQPFLIMDSFKFACLHQPLLEFDRALCFHHLQKNTVINWDLEQQNRGNEHTKNKKACDARQVRGRETDRWTKTCTRTLLPAWRKVTSSSVKLCRWVRDLALITRGSLESRHLTSMTMLWQPSLGND